MAGFNSMNSKSVFRNMLCLCIGLTSVALSVGTADVVRAANASSDVSLQTIIKAWEDRQKRFHSATFEYTTLYTDYNTVPSTDEEDKPTLEEPQGSTQDLISSEYSLHFKVSIDGLRMRYELDGQQPDGGVMIERRHLSAFDGEVSKSFSPASESIRHPTGFIHDKNRCDASNTLDTQPIRWTYATFEPAMAEFDVQMLKVASRTGIVDGHECVILETRYNPLLGDRGRVSSGVYSYWINENLDYSIVRFTWGREGETRVQIDASYEFDEKGGWVPTKWTAWRFGSGGTPRTASESTVLNYEINPTFGSEEFQIEFPPGTVVSDARPQDGIGRTGTFDYLVKTDGSRRQITWDEINASYDEILNSESGTAHRVQPSGVSRWLLIINVVLACVIVLLIILRYRFRRI